MTLDRPASRAATAPLRWGAVVLSGGLCLLACTSSTGVQQRAAHEVLPPSAITTASRGTPPLQPSTTLDTADPMPSDFFCGEFGSEHPPTLVAIDLASATPVWTTCDDSPIPSYMVGRADGATVMLVQHPHGGAGLVNRRWGRRWRGGQGDGLRICTWEAHGRCRDGRGGGNRRCDRGRPMGSSGRRWDTVGATDAHVVGGVGRSVRLDDRRRGSTAPGDDRAIDTTTGEQQWSRAVDLVDAPGGPGQSAPTVGDSVIVIPDIGGNASIVDITNGVDLRSETGPIEAHGAVLVVRDSMYRPNALIDPMSGTRVEFPDGLPVSNQVFTGQVPAVSGLVVASDPPTGPVAALRLIDTSTADVRWEIPYAPVIGGSDDQVFVVDESTLRVIDAADGAVVAEFRVPSDLVTFGSAVGGDGIVIATAEWRGSPNGGSSGAVPETSVPPDCEGGPSILDSDVGGVPVSITESDDGTLFCVGDGRIDAIGFVPRMPTADPRLDSMMTSASHAFYVVALPAGFRTPLLAVDERGGEIRTARGVSGDYLVLVEPFSGGPTPCLRWCSAPSSCATPEGAVVARVPFSGFAGDAAGQATYEEFAACLADHGVDLPARLLVELPQQSPSRPLRTSCARRGGRAATCSPAICGHRRSPDRSSSTARWPNSTVSPRRASTPARPTRRRPCRCRRRLRLLRRGDPGRARSSSASRAPVCRSSSTAGPRAGRFPAIGPQPHGRTAGTPS